MRTVFRSAAFGATLAAALFAPAASAQLADGEILDPKNGKLYKAKVKLAEVGRKLELRGYIGIPTLGRTQTWIREN